MEIWKNMLYQIRFSQTFYLNNYESKLFALKWLPLNAKYRGQIDWEINFNFGTYLCSLYGATAVGRHISNEQRVSLLQ